MFNRSFNRSSNLKDYLNSKFESKFHESVKTVKDIQLDLKTHGIALTEE